MREEEEEEEEGRRRSFTEVPPAFGGSSPSFFLIPSVCTTFPTPACVKFLTLRPKSEAGKRGRVR